MRQWRVISDEWIVIGVSRCAGHALLGTPIS